MPMLPPRSLRASGARRLWKRAIDARFRHKQRWFADQSQVDPQLHILYHIAAGEFRLAHERPRQRHTCSGQVTVAAQPN
jgi:hypothetical protein